MKADMRIGTRILAGYGLALLVVATVGVVAYRGTTEAVESADWVSHTYKVKETLAEVFSALKDAETGQRGYLLTGEERYLAPYSNAIKVLDSDIQNLRQLTADDQNEQKRLTTLEPLIAGKMAELAATVALRRRNDERAALERGPH